MKERENYVKELVTHESDFWGQAFKSTNNNLNEIFSSYWWSWCYTDISSFVDSLSFHPESELSALEAGCGSGKTSYSLSHRFEKLTLVDASKEALDYARRMHKKHDPLRDTSFHQADLFDLPYEDNSFDFVWNIGVLEHYPSKLVSEAVKEMARVVRVGGYVCVGVPNFKSLAIRKARLLSRSRLEPYLRWVPGYRLDTEKEYSTETITQFFEQHNLGNDVVVSSAGSCLPVETPLLLLTFERFIQKYIACQNFILLVAGKK